MTKRTLCFEGWHFEDEFLVSPEGNRYTESKIRASDFYIQMKDPQKILYTRPDNRFWN